MAKQIPLPKKYSIPKSWKWIEIGSLAMMRSGYPFDSKKFSNDHEGRKPLIRIRDVVRGETTTFTNEHCPDEYTIHYGDVLIGMDGDFNVAKWKSEDALLNQRVCYICSTSKLLLNDYLYYYLPDPLKKINDATPSVTVKHLSTKTLAKTSIPLPPLPEQQRIVDRIESLFAKLDEAKEKAQAVVDGFEDRKAAILHKAFTGELTEEWRKDNGVGKDTWKTVSIESVCDVFSGKGFKEKEYSTHGVKLLRISNVTYDSLIWDDTKYLPNNYIITEADLVLKLGDIVMALNRPITNNKLKVSLVDDGTYILYQRVGCLRIKRAEELISQYLQYCLLSKEFLHQVENHLQGSDQPYINLPPLKRLTIELCSIEEQTAIIKVINSINRNELRAKESAEQVIAQIDTMKKSILARAFRGELGTNDPSDESAEELLKRIL